MIAVEYTISCTDTYGDGWNGYQVRFDGVEKCAGFTSGSSRYDTLYAAGNWHKISFCHFAIFTFTLHLY
jgi:hypothetical protein